MVERSSELLYSFDAAAREEGAAGAAAAELAEARRLVELVRSEKAAAEAAERERAECAAACFEFRDGGRKRPRTIGSVST